MFGKLFKMIGGTFGRFIKRKKYRLIRPDHIESREDKKLLVWGGIPFWMIVDREMFEFMHAIDGKRFFSVILASNEKFRSDPKAAAAMFDMLVKNKLAVPADETAASTKAPENEKIPAIENISFNITGNCNLRCKFCYNLDKLNSSPKSGISADEFIEFLKCARPYSSADLNLSILGGEPFLVWDKLRTILAYSKSSGIPAMVSTNGTLINDGIASELGKLGAAVQVSVEGHEASLNDEIRGAGTFEKIGASIKMLVKNNVRTIISLVCHDKNIEMIEEFLKFGRTAGVSETRFIPLKLLGGASHSGFTPPDLQKLLQTVVSIVKKEPGYAKLLATDAFSIMADTCRYSQKKASCGSGSQTLLVDSDGALYPCLNTNMDEFKFADISSRGFDFGRIWKDSPILKKYREDTLIDHGACSGCFVRYWCLGGCPGENYINSKKYFPSHNNCDILKKSILEMFWILSEYDEIIEISQKV